METPHARTASGPSLLTRVRQKIRLKHYSIRTEHAYVEWIRRFILFHGRRHPRELGPEQVEAFLSHLAVEGNMAASTQNQAKSALLFLYREVLGDELPWLQNVACAKRPERLPVVLTVREVAAVLNRISGTNGLIARLLYGSGLRLMEAVRLRVKDVDFERGETLVREGKGAKDRVTMLPAALAEPFKAHLVLVKQIHKQDLAAGYGEVYLPFALARKYRFAATDWMWQYVFPATRRSPDPRSGKIRRHHIDEQAVQRAMRQALRETGIAKPATPHTLRHYVPFLTMSSNVKASAERIRNYRSHRTEPQPITRHSFVYL